MRYAVLFLFCLTCGAQDKQGGAAPEIVGRIYFDGSAMSYFPALQTETPERTALLVQDYIYSSEPIGAPGAWNETAIPVGPVKPAIPAYDPQAFPDLTWSISQPSGRAIIYTSDADHKLMQVWDEHDKLLLTVMRDGSVKGGNLDEAAKTFWKLWAEAFGAMCPAKPEAKEQP